MPLWADQRYSWRRQPALGALPMKVLSLALAMTLTVGTAVAQNVVPPEIVRLENVIVDGNVKFIYVGNANNHYRMFCNVKADSCIRPEENKNYLLFNSETRWKMPSATDFLTGDTKEYIQKIIVDDPNEQIECLALRHHND